MKKVIKVKASMRNGRRVKAHTRTIDGSGKSGSGGELLSKARGKWLKKYNQEKAGSITDPENSSKRIPFSHDELKDQKYEYMVEKSKLEKVRKKKEALGTIAKQFHGSKVSFHERQAAVALKGVKRVEESSRKKSSLPYKKLSSHMSNIISYESTPSERHNSINILIKSGNLSTSDGKVYNKGKHVGNISKRHIKAAVKNNYRSSAKYKNLGAGQFHANLFDSNFRKEMNSTNSSKATYGKIAEAAYRKTQRKYPHIKPQHVREWSSYASIRGLSATVKKAHNKK